MTTATARELKLPTAPFVSSVMQIEPQWIDYNGHLNMPFARRAHNRTPLTSHSPSRTSSSSPAG